jgi:hypothetical protein
MFGWGSVVQCPICGKIIRAVGFSLRLAIAVHACDGDTFPPVDWSRPTHMVEVAPPSNLPPFYRVHDGSAELASRMWRQREAYLSIINSQTNGSPPGLVWSAS